MLLSSSNRKYPPFPLFSYFSVDVCLRCLLHHILSLIAYTIRENREFVFIGIVQFMMSANSRIRLVCRSYSFVCTLHHLIIIFVQTLSEDIDLIKCQSGIICRVCKITHILSVIHYTICGTVCFQFTHFFRDGWDIICLIIIIKWEVWTITHCLDLGHETMVCTVCLSIFLWRWLKMAMRHFGPLTEPPTASHTCWHIPPNLTYGHWYPKYITFWVKSTKF